MTDDDLHAVFALLDSLAERIAERVELRLAKPQGHQWLSTQEAAEHLGMHADTLRRYAAAGKIPCEQDGHGCALHFRLADLDTWRESGGTHRPKAVVAASTRLPSARQAA